MTNGNGAPVEQAAPQLNVLAQYTKDLSFENPNAPASLGQQQQQPAINIQINVSDPSTLATLFKRCGDSVGAFPEMNANPKNHRASSPAPRANRTAPNASLESAAHGDAAAFTRSTGSRTGIVDFRRYRAQLETRKRAGAAAATSGVKV